MSGLCVHGVVGCVFCGSEEQPRTPTPRVVTIDLRVERRRGTPSRCSACDRTDPAATYDWANLSGHYEDRFDGRRRGGDAPCP